MLFDWLVTGHVIDVNPAHAVRGPKYVVKKGKTPVLTADEARPLLDSIPIVKAAAEDGAAADRPDVTFPVTTILITSWTNILPVSPTMPAVICFQRQYASQRPHGKNPCTSKTPTA
jgi:hypothetical protein